MVGTGPFRIKKYEPGHYAELEWNQRYWAKGLPRSNGLLLLIRADEATRLAELKRGAVDLASVTDPRLADQAAADTGLRVSSPPAGRRLVLWLSQERAPFRAKKLRQALSAALDRERLIAALLPGRGERTGVFPPFSPYALPGDQLARLPFHRHDRDLARRLLLDAGHPKGFPFTAMVTDDSPELMAAARAAEAQLKEAGIAMTIAATGRTALVTREKAGDFEALLGAADWTPDPDGDLRAQLRSTSRDDVIRYRNAEVDRLLDEGRAAPDGPARAEAWRKLQAVLAEDVPAVWLMARPAGFELMRATLAGYVPRPDLSRVSLKYAALPK
jgi:peptide/nickel transport system substrate-binding protein